LLELNMMQSTRVLEPIVLSGKEVRLEALVRAHAGALLEAALVDPSLYAFSPIPRTLAEAERYVDFALAAQAEGTALPFVIVRNNDDTIIGSTRFFAVERWTRPEGHPLYDRETPDACEIGYSWLTRSAIRTAANTEAKLLLLTHAFEEWNVFRVCLHTDVRNERSRAAMTRIGAQFEGILRAHRIASDFGPRDSARFSIVASEWPAVKSRLQGFLPRN
jgi:RimJ/RimL family protein N-acetyltransferase